MKEMFETINEYPWTTFFVWIMITATLCTFTDLINKFKK